MAQDVLRYERAFGRTTSPSAREHAFDHRAVIDHIVIVVFLDFFSGQLIHINYIVIAFAAGEKLERGSNEPFLVDF